MQRIIAALLRSAILIGYSISVTCLSCGSDSGYAVAVAGAAGSAGAAGQGGSAANIYIAEARDIKNAGHCLSRTLAPDSITGGIKGWLLEATPSSPSNCSCPQGRSHFSEADVLRAGTALMKDSLLCDSPNKPPCANVCWCQINPTNNDKCLNKPDDLSAAADLFGYCYIDADAGLGNSQLVADCPENARRWLRLAGQGVPQTNSNIFIAARF